MANNARQQATTERDDGVNDTGLDYRAGWVECCRALLVQMRLAAMRAKPSEAPGIRAAAGMVQECQAGMLAKMRAPAPDPG